MAYRKEVGLGASVGEIMAGWPAGTRPKRGWDMIDVIVVVVIVVVFEV